MGETKVLGQYTRRSDQILFESMHKLLAWHEKCHGKIRESSGRLNWPSHHRLPTIAGGTIGFTDVRKSVSADNGRTVVTSCRECGWSILNLHAPVNIAAETGQVPDAVCRPSRILSALRTEMHEAGWRGGAVPEVDALARACSVLICGRKCVLFIRWMGIESGRWSVGARCA